MQIILLDFGGNIVFWEKDIEVGSPTYNFVTDNSKVIRVIAGPGAGKSFALQRRIMRLLETGMASPEKILVITYSKVAAEYLKDDINKINITGTDKIVATTLHGLCHGLINNNSSIAPTRNLRFLHTFEHKPMLYDLSEAYGVLRKKEECIRTFETELETDDNSDKRFNYDVLEWLKIHNAMLFGEIITQTIKYFDENPSCPERTMFDHVLVDEYQDLNIAEQKVVDLLSANGSLVVIGDDDQSIYSFKHAHPDGIRKFNETHIGCVDHVFRECRRCPKSVVEIASRLIQHTENRIQRDFVPFKDNQDGEVIPLVHKTTKEEIDELSSMIKTESSIIALSEILVLTPTRNMAESFREKLNDLGILAKSFFKESVLKTDKLKRAFSMLNLLANPDDMVSLRYLLGQGGDKFRAKNYKRILDYASEHSISVIEVLEKVLKNDIKIPYTYQLVQVYSKIHSELQLLKEAVTKAPTELASILIDNDLENTEFVELLKVAVNRTGLLGKIDLEEWLKQVCLDFSRLISLPENIIDGDFVKIMSLHSAKGLSAKYLVVMHTVSGLIPREPTKSIEDYPKYIEEMRRLFYVAVTRCKGNQPDYPGKLIISTIEGRESRFIKELAIF